MLEEINNQLVEQEEKETSPYHDLKLACPFKGTMLINGSIAINGSTEYDIDVLLDNCYLDDITGLQGNITFKGSASENIAQNMKIVMSNYHIGLHMLKETTVNASIEVSNSLANDTYQTKLNGTVSGRKEDVKYTDFIIIIDQNAEGQSQTMKGIFELIKSDALCVVGKYEVSTLIPLTNTGKIKVNNATFKYNADNTVDMQFNGETISLDRKAELTCE